MYPEPAVTFSVERSVLPPLLVAYCAFGKPELKANVGGVVQADARTVSVVPAPMGFAHRKTLPVVALQLPAVTAPPLTAVTV